MNEAQTLPAARDIQQNVTPITRTPRCAFHAMLTGSAATLFTATTPTLNPTGTSFATALLKSIILTNTDSSARTVTLYVVASGGSAADAQTIAKDLTIAAKTTHEFIWPDETFSLNAGDFLQGLADTTLKVSCRVNVVELTL